ncbi:hypothetical protein GCM10025867_48110 (plasmid) [Frondihabitans sucicola]|uniref:HD domain-containing protein n=1 Tax=Frondihabitans sucicola TaxID=1268041 RepID=A0ABM8GVS1_9MICO|nr:HD domain-containing protein [Frondihabitans sucicola]BDZ52570.1 hypothetical protein GCM10025867_48110 [Frondihabitans sucicola]
MSTLRRAIEIAYEAHDGQFRLGGAAFITHPMAVAAIMAERGYASWVLQACWLHDVVEDTDWTIERLRAEGFSEKVLLLVDLLTRRADETYAEYIERVASDPTSTEIKLADNRHNSSPDQLQHVTPSARRSKIVRYAKSRARLERARHDHRTHDAAVAAA